MKSNRFNYSNFGFNSGLGRLIQDAFDGLEGFGGVLADPVALRQAPKTDLYEDEAHYYAVLELPGVKKSDVSVEFAEGRLEIGASLSRETADGRKNFPLKRSIELPDQVGDGEIRAKLEDGLLTVTLPKPETLKPRTIEVE